MDRSSRAIQSGNIVAFHTEVHMKTQIATFTLLMITRSNGMKFKQSTRGY